MGVVLRTVTMDMRRKETQKVRKSKKACGWTALGFFKYIALTAGGASLG
jgi:hypothetical protein